MPPHHRPPTRCAIAGVRIWRLIPEVDATHPESDLPTRPDTAEAPSARRQIPGLARIAGYSAWCLHPLSPGWSVGWPPVGRGGFVWSGPSRGEFAIGRVPVAAVSLLVQFFNVSPMAGVGRKFPLIGLIKIKKKNRALCANGPNFFNFISPIGRIFPEHQTERGKSKTRRNHRQGKGRLVKG